MTGVLAPSDRKGNSAVNCKRFMPSLIVCRCGSSRAYGLGLRAVCVVLIAFFLLPLFIPFLNLAFESTLPACCRRDGKHQCAMSASFRQPVLSTSSEPVVRALIPTCPYRSRLLMPTVSRAVFAPSTPALSVPVVLHSTLGLETILLARISEFRGHLKRGPPSLPS